MLNKLTVQELYTGRASYFSQEIRDRVQSESNINGQCVYTRNSGNEWKAKEKRDEMRRNGLYGFFWLYWREQSSPDALEHEEVKAFLSNCKEQFRAEIANGDTLKEYIQQQALFCADLSELPLTGRDFKNADFRFSNLHQSNFSRSSLIGVDFGDANLTKAQLEHALDFSQIKNLEGANLTGATFNHADMKAFKEGKDGLYRVIFDEEHLPASYTKDRVEKDTKGLPYKKNLVEKQELENQIRESYANAKNEKGENRYDANLLKLIQASGNSPLNWAKYDASFDMQYESLKSNQGILVKRMRNQIKDMLDNNNLEGYEQARISHRWFKTFSQQKNTRVEQLAELAPLSSKEESGPVVSLENLADTLLTVSNQLRLEDDFFYSELRRQIEQISSPNPDDYPTSKYKA